MRDRPVAFPEALYDLETFGEGRGVVLEIGAERSVFAPVVAAAAGEIDAPAAQEIERRPLLGDADRMMQRQHIHRRRKANALRLRRNVGQHQLGRRVHAERAEMMLADPGGMKAELFGIDRLGNDLLHELIRCAPIVAIVVVAEGEIAELHAA